MSENKYKSRRKKLKKNLYLMLREEQDGIPKAFLWNQYSSRYGRISANFFGTSKMHNMLEEFDDMLYEVMHNGRPTIRLLQGYTQEDSEEEEEEEEDDVQISKVSSSKPMPKTSDKDEKTQEKKQLPKASNEHVQEPDMASALMGKSSQEQKQILGEHLFPLVSHMFPDHAGKLTGMMLEIDNSELLHMLQSKDALESKTKEAMAVLQDHQKKQLPKASTEHIQEPDITSALMGKSPQEQKQILGEHLFPLVSRMFPDHAGKLTGMMLEVDNSELLHMLQSKDALESKTEEAMAVLQAHQKKESASKGIQSLLPTPPLQYQLGNQTRLLPTPSLQTQLRDQAGILPDPPFHIKLGSQAGLIPGTQIYQGLPHLQLSIPLATSVNTLPVLNLPQSQPSTNGVNQHASKYSTENTSQASSSSKTTTTGNFNKNIQRESREDLLLVVSDSESDSDTDSSDEYSTLKKSEAKKEKDDWHSKVERERLKIKHNLELLLRKHPNGIKKTEIWRIYNEEFKHQPDRLSVGVSKLTKVLDLFDDVMEEYPNEHGIPFINLISNLRGKKTDKWGMGATAPSMKSEPKQKSSKGQPAVIDLTDDSMPQNRNLVDLTEDQHSSGFISLAAPQPVVRVTSESSRQELMARQGDYQVRSSYTQLQRLPDFVLPDAPPDGAMLGLPSMVIKPVSMRKFEQKDIFLPRIWNNDRYGRFSENQVKTAAKECIEALSEANEYVSTERVEQMLLQRFGKQHIQNLGHWRYVNHIPCVNEHLRTLSKVNAYIQAFLNTRSICTLHELKECMAEFAPEKDSFANLQIGPLQRLPIIYQHFKFPTDMADIPEITTSDILENLRNYLNKYQKWTERLEMESFMEYLVTTYNVENAYILGIRIRSLPLACQVLKKSQRDAAATRRKVTEDFKSETKKEIENVFKKFSTAIMQKGEDGKSKVRQHYLKISPENALAEVFEKFNLLCVSIDPPLRRERRQFQKFVDSVTNFLSSVRPDGFGRLLFHLAICISNTELEKAAEEILVQASKPRTEAAEEKKQPPAKSSVVDLVKRYLQKCLEYGPLSLKSFDQIEERTASDFGFESFISMGYGRFIEFLLKENKQELEDGGGTSLGSGGGHQEMSGGYMPTRTHLLEFLHQCKQCNVLEVEKIETAMCHQFSVREVKHLGHGTIARLFASVDKHGKHVFNQHSVMYEASLIPPSGFEEKGQTGILGHQSKEAALACLDNCPMLEDIGDWSHWSLVFEPQFGKLRDFIQKYGGVHQCQIEGGKKLMITDFVALESTPGRYLRLISQSSPDKFYLAVQRRSAREASGHLMSMVVCNKGVDNTPLALLANQMKEELFRMHGEGSVESVPGAPPSHDDDVDLAVRFVLDCMLVLPVKTCSVLASQLFLEPLAQVVGHTKSKSLLLQACQTVKSLSYLQQLGCLLGISEWTKPINLRCQPKSASVEEIPAEEAEEFFEDVQEIVESEDEESSSSSYLSDMEEDFLEKMKDVQEEEMIVLDEASIDNSSTDDKTDQESVKEGSADVTEETACEDKPAEILPVEADIDENEQALTGEEKRELECKHVVEQIQRDEFGIGVELNEDGQRLMKVQQERLGRSLDRLSKDLYSKDTHFVLELIQNADDNSYPDHIFIDNTTMCPSVTFVVRTDGVVVLNNENGFKEKDIRALCDVGRSTKGKHKAGYIGQKGIGFKSVFRVTDKPEVHSNGYHIQFDVNSGPTGYILPHWVNDTWIMEEEWTTKIVLPLKETMKAETRTLAARFNDIHPSLLLFLNRLRQITVENKVESSVQTMRRQDLGESVVEIVHNNQCDRWLVVKKKLDASKISLQAKSGVEVESTEVALAFPLRPTGQKKDAKFVPPKQPVFAFLPLRSYGFRFIIQGDFDVPSSREDVDRDSSWNQWIRNEIHTLFIEALENFKMHQDFSNMEAVTTFLQFVPVEDEILDFFRPVAAQILQKLRSKSCVPTQPNSKGQCMWKIPSQTVMVKDPLILEVVTPELLKDNLNLFYLHREVAACLNASLTQSLGIECVTTEHLLLIGKSLIQQWDKNQDSQDSASEVTATSKWMACVYRSLDEFRDNQAVYDKLKDMRIVPLANYKRESTAERTIFFALSEDNVCDSHKDPMFILQRDLKTIHPLLTSTKDNEVNSQVQKLLLKMGVCQLSSKDVICHHIMPTLTSDQWKEKSRDVLVSYMIYLKEQLEMNSSLINLDELAKAAIVMTNKGPRNPKDTPIHLTPLYRNQIDLQSVLPGYDWVLVDAVYLQNTRNQIEINKWREFFIKIGLTDFVIVKQVRVDISGETIKSTPWAPLSDICQSIPEGSYIEDWASEELHDLILNNSKMATYQEQMYVLCSVLARDWDSKYSRYVMTNLFDKNGGRLRDMETSLSIVLRTSSWLPAIQTCVHLENDVIIVNEKVVMMQPSCLYSPLPQIKGLLAHSVIYVDAEIVPNSSFASFLKIKIEIILEDLKKFLIDWGHRENDSKPAIFCTTQQHINHVYQWLQQHLPPVETQNLLHDHPVIFVPQGDKMVRVDSSRDRYHNPPPLVAGQMLSRQEVWWQDKTQLIKKYGGIIKEYHCDIGNKSVLSEVYGMNRELQEFFCRGGRIAKEPTISEYGELLVLLGQVLNLTEKSVLTDTLNLYVAIGEKLFVSVSDPEKVTKEAVLEQEKDSLMRLLKGQKFLATKRDQWVGLDDHPLIADNRELEKMFEKKDRVNFLVTEDRRSQPKRGARYIIHDRNSDLLPKLMPLFELCNVKKLSKSIATMEITEMFEPCPSLQYYIHLAVPLLQRYLFKYYPEIYQSKVSANFPALLNNLQFVKVSKLEVRYSISHIPDVFHLNTEKCLQKDNSFYFHKDHTESYQDINREISKFFSNLDDRCSKDLRSFLNDLTQALTKEDSDSIEKILDLHDCDLLPDEEEVWFVKPPDRPVYQEPELEFYPEEEEVVSENKSVEPQTSENKGQGLKAWPPMSDTSGIKHSKEPKEKDDKPKDSKMWPPPKAPDYLKSVKELPAQFKVTDETRAPPSEEVEASSKRDKSNEGGAIGEGVRYQQQSSNSSGTNVSYQRQDSEGKGTKRKISENESVDGMDSKRVVTSTGSDYQKETSSQVDKDKPSGEKTETTSENRHKPGPKEGEGQEQYMGSTKDSYYQHDKRTGNKDADEREQNVQRQDMEGERPSPGKRRYRSESGGSPRAPDAKRLLMDDPIWTQFAGDYTFEELGRGSMFKDIPEYITLDQDKAETPEIGRWGEFLVYHYLLRQQETQGNIIEIKWCNEDDEKGTPYDFELTRATEDGTTVTFIEVKSTMTEDKDIFEISSQQVRFAQEHKENFVIYRVFNAGDMEKVRLVKIDNLSMRLDQKQVRLWMMI